MITSTNSSSPTKLHFSLFLSLFQAYSSTFSEISELVHKISLQLDPINFLVAMDGNGTESKTQNQNKGLNFLELSLRLCVIPFALSSLFVMVSNKQTSDIYGTVEFNNLTGFKYLVCINAISCGYSLASIFISKLKCFKIHDWVLFILDQVMTYLMITSGSAVTEILYLSEKGDREVSWSEVCSYFGFFCNKTKISLALHVIALLCFIILSLISAFKLFSKFEAPNCNKEENGGVIGK
ncbi:hypothetical protein LUZ60_005477 [Juncus effusus]|nr:hypothetical protein LUZ60_005477 [Juncus effusus]